MSQHLDWNDPVAATNCEGILLNNLVPGFDEFFTGVAGFFVIAIALAGLFQPRLDVTTKLMYSGLILNGLGTIAFYWRRLQVFYFFLELPIFATIAFAILAFFDEMVFEVRRARAFAAFNAGHQPPTGGAPFYGPRAGAAGPPRLVKEACKSFVLSLFYTLILAYLVVGMLILVFYDGSEVSYGVYFGAPLALFALVVMFYIIHRQRKLHLPHSASLFGAAVAAVGAGVISVAFKAIDVAGCSSITVWLFPNPIFHIFLAFALHCIITFITFFRANNFVLFGEAFPRLVWRAGFFPMVSITLRAPAHFEPPYGMPIDPESYAPPTGENQYAPLPREQPFWPQAPAPNSYGLGFPMMSAEDLRGSRH